MQEHQQKATRAPAVYLQIPNRGPAGSNRRAYFIRLSDLPGCAIQAHDPADVHTHAAAVLRGWLELNIFDGDSFNPPSDSVTLHAEDDFVELVRQRLSGKCTHVADSTCGQDGHVVLAPSLWTASRRLQIYSTNLLQPVSLCKDTTSVLMEIVPT